MNKIDILKSLTFGARVAEDEREELKKYFVKTDQWRKIFSGDIDIIYGPKGSGKSAIYSFLVSSENELFSKNILITPAENPRGTPVFKHLLIDPPASEQEFIRLWKVYFLLIIGGQIKEYNLPDSFSKQVINKLEECNLIPKKNKLPAILKSALDYIRFRNVSAIEPGISVNESGIPTGFNCKVIFNEPSQRQVDEGCVSIDALFETVNLAMKENKLTLWIALDRLDVAFSENSDLESNALKALFRVYLDLVDFEYIRLKIFLRDDIWKRITENGFREASHITRHTTISWNKETLLHLIISRLLNNNNVIAYYKINRKEVLENSDRQSKLFYIVFPHDMGSSEVSKSLDWIISRTRDGKKIDSPREIIHLLNVAIEEEIRSLEIGKSALAGRQLIDKSSIKKSLKEVSKTKLTTVLFAEYPDYMFFIEQLNNEKSLLTCQQLQGLWNRNRKNAIRQANLLVEVGFFERKGPKDSPDYEVPYIYRPYLNMT